MLISLVVTNGGNFKEIEEPLLTILGDLEWNDPAVKILPIVMFGLLRHSWVLLAEVLLNVIIFGTLTM